MLEGGGRINVSVKCFVNVNKYDGKVIQLTHSQLHERSNGGSCRWTTCLYLLCLTISSISNILIL